MLGVDALPAVGLEEVVSQAALLDRVDVKYVVAVDRFAALVERLAATHAVLERDGGYAFPYRTTYFDTADLVTYRAHQRSRRSTIAPTRVRTAGSSRSRSSQVARGARQIGFRTSARGATTCASPPRPFARP